MMSVPTRGHGKVASFGFWPYLEASSRCVEAASGRDAVGAKGQVATHAGVGEATGNVPDAERRHDPAIVRVASWNVQD
jgi:hypothetical protein